MKYVVQEFYNNTAIIKKNNLLQIQSSESESGTVITNAQSHDNYKKTLLYYQIMQQVKDINRNNIAALFA